MEARRELQLLIDHFDEGPLTLQQLSRIAIRRAVGGADFVRKVRRIKSHIPPLLFDYVTEANEHMLTDYEVRLLDASMREHKAQLRKPHYSDPWVEFLSNLGIPWPT